MDDNRTKKILNIIFNLDRRVVYIFMFLAITLPFFLKPVETIKTTRWVHSVYELVEEAAQRNKPILIGFDYDPSTLAELQPMAVAMLRHAFSRGVKVLGINFTIQGTTLAADTMDLIAREFDKEYGVDYVFFGWVPQFSLVIRNFGDDFRNSYTRDYHGNNINDIEMLKNLRNYDDFHLVTSFSGTALPQVYITYGVTRFNFNFVAGVTAVSATEYYVYLQTGQMKGFLAGMKGAAEYEYLINQFGDGMRGMTSQSWGHLTIIFFIIVGNILYYLKKRFESEERSA